MRPPEFISTERLILRKPHMDDASAIFAGWVQDLEVTRHLTWHPHENIETTKSMLERAVVAWEQGLRFPFIIADKNTNQLAGMIEIRTEGHKAEIGYVLAREFWGKGYMTEAVRALIDWAFQQPAMYRVYATTSVENFGSQRVMEKAGMQREGLLRKYIVHPNISDVPRDSYMYAVVK
jgi:RimJ/RimL family protein N-acetyltransferase